MDSDAFVLGLILSNSFMASSPKGVAAFPIPNTFAHIFITIFSFALVSFFILGNKRLIKGSIISLKALTAEDFYKIADIPVQKHIMPVNPNTTFTAVLADSRIPAETSAVLPDIKPTITDIIIKAAQI